MATFRNTSDWQGTLLDRDLPVAYLMWFYVLIFALLAGANFADRYSLDRIWLAARPER